MKQKNIYASLEGFKYYVKAKPYLGAYVAMENFSQGLLKYGSFDEYHCYFEDNFFNTLTKEELKKTFFDNEKVKFKRLSSLLEAKGQKSHCKIIHNETIIPDREILFRNLLPQRNIPLTRQTYTIATNAHLRQLLDICLLGFGARPYDSIITPSKPAKEAIHNYFSDVCETTKGKVHYNGRIDVIPYGIDLECLQPKEKPESREKLGLPADALILLSTARFSNVSKMNYTRFILFFSQLIKKTNRKVFFLFAGADINNQAQGIMKEVEEAGLSDKVKFIVNFSDSLKPYIFSAADIFISLSDNLQESFGISLVEAMACGLPVICTDWDGYKDIIEDGVTGFKIPLAWKARTDPTDILALFRHPYDHTVIHRISRELNMDTGLLIKRTLELIDNEGFRKKMSQAGRQKAQREYSIKTVISRYERLWNELSRMAQKDRKEYPDLGSLLYYNYPEHFKAFPTSIQK
ncbi:MAG: glycosyltransferase family 4 protein [Candidatus Omnitrophica bacterium]|nr:glycosyltransferase family 4 protein [Candidatus Omnitrophota bacterium]